MISGAERDAARTRFDTAVRSLLHGQAARKAAIAEQSIAIKAQEFQDDDGVIIAVLSKAGVFDREDERALVPALKAATWDLVMRGGPPQGFDVLHEEDTQADVVGAYYDYENDRAVVHLRPHDRALFDAAKSGEIIGLSWSGPYTLKDAS